MESQRSGLEVPYTDFTFDVSQPVNSASCLVAKLARGAGEENSIVDPDLPSITVTQLTQGTTNLLFKVTLESLVSPVISTEDEITNVFLIKIYGDGTDQTVDREKELKFHETLSKHHLAPALLLRFKNGHAYNFLPGNVCTDEDLTKESIWRGVARELAQWHTIKTAKYLASQSRNINESREDDSHKQLNSSGSILPLYILSNQPNIWVTAEKWLNHIPSASPEQLKQKDSLRKEFTYLVEKLLISAGSSELVFGHGDLLSGNIIIDNTSSDPLKDAIKSVMFIDYEHCTLCPVAFELSNHFAEWSGFNCDYTRLPSRSVRREFVKDYVAARSKLYSDYNHTSQEDTVSRIMVEIDNFRGFPGFYWGLCALIQASTASGSIDFNYAGYADLRLAEYWAWKHEIDRSREKSGEEIPLRENFWAREN